MTEILMALHELLIGLISGIKMQLTYSSQRLRYGPNIFSYGL